MARAVGLRQKLRVTRPFSVAWHTSRVAWVEASGPQTGGGASPCLDEDPVPGQPGEGASPEARFGEDAEDGLIPEGDVTQRQDGLDLRLHEVVAVLGGEEGQGGVLLVAVGELHGGGVPDLALADEQGGPLDGMVVEHEGHKVVPGDPAESACVSGEQVQALDGGHDVPASQEQEGVVVVQAQSLVAGGRPVDRTPRFGVGEQHVGDVAGVGADATAAQLVRGHGGHVNLHPASMGGVGLDEGEETPGHPVLQACGVRRLGERGGGGGRPLFPTTQADAEGRTRGTGLQVHVHDALDGAHVDEGQAAPLEEPVHEALVRGFRGEMPGNPRRSSVVCFQEPLYSRRSQSHMCLYLPWVEALSEEKPGPHAHRSIVL